MLIFALPFSHINTIYCHIMKRNIIVFGIIIAVIATLFSCGKRPAEYVIGISQCSEDVWRKKLNDELRISAYAHDNVELKILSADDNAAMQIRQIDSLADLPVDLLVVAPIDATITKAIERVYDKGIPVIVFDRRTNSSKYTAYIGADNNEMGKNMARYLTSQTKETARVIEICGLMSSSPAIGRKEGFDKEAATHHNINIVEHVEADWTEQTAFSMMDSLLSCKHPAFNCVYAHNDRMAAGARRAVVKHHIDPKSIIFLGIDAIPQGGGGMQMVRDGELLASYIYPTRGDKLMELAMNILEKKKYERENLLSSALVTNDNASVLLMQNDETKRQSDDLISLRKRVETTTNAFDTQRSYLFMLLFLVVMLIIACSLAMKAFLVKTKYNRQLNVSLQKQKKTAEEVEQMTSNQLRFFTNISHELRTPLTLISGPADQLAETGNFSGEARKLVDMIRRNVGILTQMVGEILEFRKIQNDKAKLSLNRFDIAKALYIWSNDFKMVAERKQIKLEISVKTDGECIVIADKEKIAHVFFNLMTNAIKYTPQHGCITISLEHSDGRYVVSVADTGKGMSTDDMRHVFERFYQSKDSVGGTGIGLAIVKAYVELHKGEVGVESELQKGCRFYFSIPESQPGYDAALDKQDEIKSEPRLADDYSVKDIISEQNLSAITGTEDYDSNRPLVLVVDDNEGMRTYLKGILHAKYNVIEAQNGEEGLKLSQRMVPQLVISDVMMPVMNGLEFCSRIKNDVSTSHIPVIILTAKSLEEQRKEGYDSGADSYITKPFTAETLISRIDNLLKNRCQLRKIFSGSMLEEEEQKELGEKDNTFISQLRKTIKKHIPDAEYSVEDLGSEMGLSRVQLYRKVKALTGYSVVDLLRKARLSRAKQLLETTDKNISEVAYEVGFSTPSYFAKRFKEEFGISPGDVGK